ncbi:glycosyltransferase [Bacteroidota bacterium]
MKQQKVILILHHPPTTLFPLYKSGITPENCNEHYYSCEWENIGKYPHWVGFFRGDHHELWAKMLKKEFPNLLIECWRPYSSIIDRVYSKDVDGITHKIFPSHAFSRLRKWFKAWMCSPLMVRELKKEKEKYNVLIHIVDGHSDFSNYLVNRMFKESIPVVISQGSDSYSKQSYLSFEWYRQLYHYNYLINAYFQEKALHRTSYLFSASVRECAFLRKKLPWFSGYEHYVGTIDYEYFKNDESQDVIGLKRKYKIKDKLRVILFVGRFNSITDMKDLVDSWYSDRDLKAQTQLVCIGGYNTDEYYKYAQEREVVLIPRSKTDVLKEVYTITDVAVYPIFDKTLVNMGGFGISNAECLAFGIPLVSNNLIHFPGKIEERNSLGVLMPNREAMITGIKHILDNPEYYTHCREISRKYFDNGVLAKKYHDKYKELFQNYY